MRYVEVLQRYVAWKFIYLLARSLTSIKPRLQSQNCAVAILVVCIFFFMRKFYWNKKRSDENHLLVKIKKTYLYESLKVVIAWWMSNAMKLIAFFLKFSLFWTFSSRPFHFLTVKEKFWTNMMIFVVDLLFKLKG